MTRLKHKFKCFRQPFLGRMLLTLFIIASMAAIAIWITTPDTTAAKNCFKYSKNEPNDKRKSSIIFLEDVMQSMKKPKPGKTIFFHETSCVNDGLIHLNARQACAIESAAKLNPNWDVFLIFASPVGVPNDSVTTTSSPIIAALQSYQNVFMRKIDLWTYVVDTPLEDWLSSDALFRSKFLNSHVSDFLRYLTLYKFGGTYMDLDVVVQQHLDKIAPNYSGAESDEAVAAGVMSFDHDGVGHDIAELCVNEFKETFNGEDWGNNGPGVITRVLQKICHTENTLLMSRERCQGFKVYPASTFYAIPWRKWYLFFDPNSVNRTFEITKDSIAIHVWNKHSMKQKFKIGSKVAYGIAAEKNCPIVYHSSGEYF